jgi:hypothetical protein
VLTLALALAFTFIALGIVERDQVAAAQPAVQATQAQSAQSAEKTVDETQKNIQVLKGLPESQLRPLMNMISASLGVTCANCHVRTGNQWEFDKDDKKAKQTARKMIQMTMEINKASFNGKAEVSCYTCHNGKGHPLIAPALPLPARAPGPPAEVKPADFVTPQQVLEKYLQALGGKPAASKLKTRVLKGSLVMNNGQSLPFEVRLAGPDKIMTIMTTPQQGVITQALSSSGGWVRNSREQRAMNSIELDRIRSLAWCLDPLPLKEPYPRLTFGGVEKIGDRDANILRMITPDKKRVRLFFDKETGLLVRREMMTDTPIGSDPEQVDFEDYRDVDGVKVPFSIRMSYLDPLPSGTRKFTEIKHNVTLDEAEFRPPASRQ